MLKRWTSHKSTLALIVLVVVNGAPILRTGAEQEWEELLKEES